MQGHISDRHPLGDGKRFILIPLLVIAVVLVFDQVLKYWVKHNMDYATQKTVIDNFFYLYFIENNGMAFGYELGGEWGKILLTLFRIIAVIFGTWYFVRLIKRGANKGLIISIALILAGALGNIIDSVFYGVIYKPFTEGGLNDYEGGWFHGRVVDMLYFPILKGHYPSWFPFVGGQDFIFFRPIFNIADSAITGGVLTILLFQKRYFPRHPEHEETTTTHTDSTILENVNTEAEITPTSEDRNSPVVESGNHVTEDPNANLDPPAVHTTDEDKQEDK